MIRADCVLALHMKVSYTEVAAYDDRVKATLWRLLEEADERDRDQAAPSKPGVPPSKRGR